MRTFHKRHPHIATWIVLALIALFIYINVALTLWPLIIVLLSLAAAGAYSIVYSFVTGDL